MFRFLPYAGEATTEKGAPFKAPFARNAPSARTSCDSRSRPDPITRSAIETLVRPGGDRDQSRACKCCNCRAGPSCRDRCQRRSSPQCLAAATASALAFFRHGDALPRLVMEGRVLQRDPAVSWIIVTIHEIWSRHGLGSCPLENRKNAVPGMVLANSQAHHKPNPLRQYRCPQTPNPPAPRRPLLPLR